MGFHPKNGLHQGMKVRLSIWTLWKCVSKTVNGFKTENCKNWKLTVKKFKIEDLGH